MNKKVLYKIEYIIKVGIAVPLGIAGFCFGVYLVEELVKLILK